MRDTDNENHSLDFFNRDFVEDARLNSIRSYKLRATWGTICLFLLVGIPFGPVGCVIFGIAGALLGFFIGSIIDWKKINFNRRIHRIEHKGLIHFSRWANTYFALSDEKDKFVQNVVLRFKATELAIRNGRLTHLQIARKDFKLLLLFISRDDVQHELFLYSQLFRKNWRSLTANELIKFESIALICHACYSVCNKTPSSTISLLHNLAIAPASFRLFRLACPTPKISPDEKKRLEGYFEADRAKNDGRIGKLMERAKHLGRAPVIVGSTYRFPENEFVCEDSSSEIDPALETSLLKNGSRHHHHSEHRIMQKSSIDLITSSNPIERAYLGDDDNDSSSSCYSSSDSEKKSKKYRKYKNLPIGSKRHRRMSSSSASYDNIQIARNSCLPESQDDILTSSAALKKVSAFESQEINFTKTASATTGDLSNTNIQPGNSPATVRLSLEQNQLLQSQNVRSGASRGRSINTNRNVQLRESDAMNNESLPVTADPLDLSANAVEMGAFRANSTANTYSSSGVRVVAAALDDILPICTELSSDDEDDPKDIMGIRAAYAVGQQHQRQHHQQRIQQHIQKQQHNNSSINGDEINLMNMSGGPLMSPASLVNVSPPPHNSKALSCTSDNENVVNNNSVVLGVVSSDKLGLVRSETLVEPIKVEEPRLFQSYDDMVAFDPQIKWKEPIREYEFEFLDELEGLPVDADGWVGCVDRDDLKISKKMVEGSDVIAIRGNVVFANIPPDVVTNHIAHIPTRTTWDKSFDDYHLPGIDRKTGCEIVYHYLRAPFPATNRDFLQWRRIRTDETTSVSYILSRNCKRDDVFPSEVKNTIRADTVISGYVIRPLDQNNLKKGTRLFLIAQNDVRGSVPKFLVNTAAQRVPLTWATNLKNACEKWMKDHPGKLRPDANEAVITSKPLPPGKFHRDVKMPH